MGIFKSASVYKILLPLVILVVLAVVFYVVVLHRETQSPDSEKISAIIQSATFTPPGTDVKATLTGGQAYFTYEDTESFALVQHILGIHETNSGTDVFAEVAVNTGGSGVFVYLGLFHVVDDMAELTSSYAVGDRVKLTDVTLPDGTEDTYTLTLDYLDRGVDEPFSTDPHIQKSTKLEVRDHKIVQ